MSKKGQTKATVVKTTKTTKKQVFSPEDTQVFTNVFSLFDTQGNGKLDIGELLNAMEAFKFDKTNPGIFDLLSELDTPEAKVFFVKVYPTIAHIFLIIGYQNVFVNAF